MSQGTSRWWRGAVLLGLSWLAVARPAPGQDEQPPPQPAPPQAPREVGAGHPLASRAALVDSAQRSAAAGDTVRAAAIRARLATGDFQPGERIWMRVDSEPALSDTFTVTTAGTVVFPSPVNHEIPLKGVLRSELQGYLVQQLSQYLRNPALRARALVRVSVQGGVVRPGYYAVPADALVADALMAAGGTLPTSKPGKMQLERGGERLLDGKALAQAVAEGRTLDDLNIQDGDQLVVPKEGAGMGDNLRFLWVVVSITGGIVGLTKVFGH
jgi:protein involved in polysaccharide export with SLBB domain